MTGKKARGKASDEPALDGDAPLELLGERPAGLEGEEQDRLWRRVQAGLAVERGLVGRETLQAWQAAIRAKEFDADECADEILGEAGPAEEGPLDARTARLLQDFLMVSLAKGSRGAARKARVAARTGLAAGLSSFLVFAALLLLVFLLLLVLRLRGVEIDALLDTVLMRN